MQKSRTLRARTFVALAMIAALAFFTHSPPAQSTSSGAETVKSIYPTQTEGAGIAATKIDIAPAAAVADRAVPRTPAANIDLEKMLTSTDTLAIVSGAEPAAAFDSRLRGSTKSELTMYTDLSTNSIHSHGAGGTEPGGRLRRSILLTRTDLT